MYSVDFPKWEIDFPGMSARFVKRHIDLGRDCHRNGKIDFYKLSSIHGLNSDAGKFLESSLSHPGDVA